MRFQLVLPIALGVAGAATALCQIPPPAGKKQGPGVQAAADERYPDVIKSCKTPPPTPAGRGGRGRGRGPEQAGPRDYTITEISGVIAAGQKWREVWQVDGNNADG